MTLFGICPEQEDIILVVCKECGRVVKAAAFLRHCGKSLFIILRLFEYKTKSRWTNVITFCQFLTENQYKSVILIPFFGKVSLWIGT